MSGLVAAPLIIDGALFEGGGQILRIAVAISLLTKKPIIVQNIRDGRPKPGMRPQHEQGVKLLEKLSRGGCSEGVYVGSRTLNFQPGELQGGNIHITCDTAASTTLIIQSALPCLLFAPEDSTVRITGGTNVPFSPPIEYMEDILLYYLKKHYNVEFTLSIIRRGFFPRGGGEIKLSTHPIKALEPINLLDQGQITKIKGVLSTASSTPEGVLEDTAFKVVNHIKRAFPGAYVSIGTSSHPCSQSTQISYLIYVETSTGLRISASDNCDLRKEFNNSFENSLKELKDTVDSGACVDGHTQDQLLPFMLLASGHSKMKIYKLTEHSKALLSVFQTFFDDRKLYEIENDGYSRSQVLSVTGVGIANQHL